MEIRSLLCQYFGISMKELEALIANKGAARPATVERVFWVGNFKLDDKAKAALKEIAGGEIELHEIEDFRHLGSKQASIQLINTIANGGITAYVKIDELADIAKLGRTVLIYEYDSGFNFVRWRYYKKDGALVKKSSRIGMF